MAIRIVNIKVNGIRVRNERQLEAARRIETLLKEAGIEGEVQISRFYADRWYDLDVYKVLFIDYALQGRRV